jgi:hypothetical protein
VVTNNEFLVRFEVFTAVTVKNGVFWDVTPFGYCKNRRNGGFYKSQTAAVLSELLQFPYYSRIPSGS